MRLLAMSVTLALTAPAWAAEGDSWECRVISFDQASPFYDEGDEHAAMNMRKTYTLVDGGQDITVVTHSSDVPSRSERYTVVLRGIEDIAVASKGAGLKTLVMATVGLPEIDGAVPATLATQSSGGFYVSALACRQL